MGSWQLEVFRMTMYVFFPVITFYMYHTPTMQKLLDTKRLIADPIDYNDESNYLRKATERREQRRAKYMEQKVWKEDF